VQHGQIASFQFVIQLYQLLGRKIIIFIVPDIRRAVSKSTRLVSFGGRNRCETKEQAVAVLAKDIRIVGTDSQLAAILFRSALTIALSIPGV